MKAEEEAVAETLSNLTNSPPWNPTSLSTSSDHYYQTFAISALLSILKDSLSDRHHKFMEAIVSVSKTWESKHATFLPQYPSSLWLKDSTLQRVLNGRSEHFGRSGNPTWCRLHGRHSNGPEGDSFFEGINLSSHNLVFLCIIGNRVHHPWYDVKESLSHICMSLVDIHASIADEFSNAAFISCWGELYGQPQVREHLP